MLAKSGFGTSEVATKAGNLTKPKKKTGEKVPVATAAGFLAADKPIQKKKQGCLFCEKSRESKECFQAQKMALLEKKGILSSK